MSDNTIVKTSEITIKVGLNKENVPVDIKWDAESQGEKECKAFLLSIFDKDNRETLKIDLWTNEMQVMEMDRFFYQTLRALSDTYFKATKNNELASDMQKFVQFFGEKTEIIPK